MDLGKVVVSRASANEEKDACDDDSKDIDDRPNVCSPDPDRLSINQDSNKGRFSPDLKRRYLESKEDDSRNGARANSSSYSDHESSTIGNSSNSFNSRNGNSSKIPKESRSMNESTRGYNENEMLSSPMKLNTSRKYDRIPRSDTVMYSKSEMSRINKDIPKTTSAMKDDAKYGRDSIDETEDETDCIENLDADEDDTYRRRRSNRRQNGQTSYSSDSDDDVEEPPRQTSSAPFQRKDITDRSEVSSQVAKTKSVLPPPSAAPPRRAKDLLDEEGNSSRSRRSVEEMISSRRSTRIEQELSDDETDAKVGENSYSTLII